jgi:hypothetical protein
MVRPERPEAPWSHSALKRSAASSAALEAMNWDECARNCLQRSERHTMSIESDALIEGGPHDA